jgi:uncharacterized protein (TIGR02996 family)
MRTEEELLAAIDADPEEAPPRLAHAEWLAANGQASRAEFIRACLSRGYVDQRPWLACPPSVA